MSVAERIIKKLGGAYKVAGLLGCHPSRVYRWTYPTERGGTGGFIPQRQQLKLLELAEQGKAKLRHADFNPKRAA